TACDLGTLPAPSACTSSTGTNIGATVTYSCSNTGATATNPYSALIGCASPATDVWYRFVASATTFNINITSSTITNPSVSLYIGGDCNNLLGQQCFTGTSGNLTGTFSPWIPDSVYYLQVSGGTTSDVGDFTMTLSNDFNCANCLLGENLTVTPAPVNGTYQPGQTVTFCFTVTDYNQSAANWLHGVTMNFGAGWDVSTLTPTSIPASCSTVTGASWGYYNSCTSTATGNTYGPGFYYETSLGASCGCINGNPGDNYGDPDVGSNNCYPTFCWQITTRPDCSAGTSLLTRVSTTGDWASGSWGSPGCQNDPVANFSAELICCVPPTIATVAPTCGGSNGSATATGQGTAPWTYHWENTAGTVISNQTGVNGPNTISGLAAGQYFVTVTDANGCSTAAIANVGNPTGVTASASNTGPYCVGGTISLHASTGTGFSWSGPNSFSSTLQNPTIAGATNAMAGTYTVTVTDAGGCTATASTTVVVNTGSGAAINPTSASICPGNNTTLTASGGTGYSWSNAATTAAITISPANTTTYTVTVSTANGCSSTASATVTVNPVPSINISPANPSVCPGVNATLTASGALGYLWSTTETTASITVSPGTPTTYSVTGADANTCTASASVNVDVHSAPVVSVTPAAAQICAGQSIIIVANGAYSYVWSTGDTTVDITKNPTVATVYDVTGTDVYGCTGTASANITMYPAVTFTGAVTNVLCNSGSDGEVDLTITAAQTPETYLWSDGQTTQNAVGLFSDSIEVTVTDGNTCTASAAYYVSEPTALVFGAPTIQNIGCNGGSTGSVTAMVSGGTPGYTYNWQAQGSGQTYTGQNISSLGPDDYAVTVTDNNGCLAYSDYQVTAIPLLSFTTSSTNISCNGANDGAALVTVGTGTGPYQYSWNGNGVPIDSVMNNIQPGNVSVTVTDANNCTGTAQFTIAQPTALLITELSRQDVGCNGNTDGAIVLQVTGGTTSYNYIWSNQNPSLSNTGLAAGTYTFTVTDANLCSATFSDVITEPTLLTATPIVQDSRCFQGTDGQIDANPAGGTPPYYYNWSDGHSQKVNMFLAAGTYLCTVTDQEGCSVLVDATINEPTQILVFDSATAVKCIGQSNGTIIVSASGGSGVYSYSATQDFSNFFYAENGVITGLDTGVFTIVVSDSNGCTLFSQATVPNAIPDDFLTATDSTTCYGPNYNDGAAHISATTVQNGPYQYSIDGGGYQNTGDFYSLAAGPHVIMALNANGCEDSIPVVVYQPLPIEVQITPDTVALPLGGSQAVQVNYLNANNPSYDWNPVIGLSCADCPNPTVNTYTPGVYTVTVSMVNGSSICYGTATLYVTVGPHSPVFIPNSFSPNGDGNNDVFLIYGQDIKTIDLKVFNRWGELVYQTNNQFAGWDGTYKGQLQNPGVFTYEAVVTFLDDTKFEKAGSITLVR
ncbi:MAG TPA: gliding motility-associated C-terminal domain-containing protein, partial [Chitinophagales bacterium]|nr:gliding motility-associated C-terminal domain-containing protein [Chitinophagales bacterium]